MKKELRITGAFSNPFGCFGTFEIQDAVCRNRCALRLRCCIEKENNTRMEILEDLVSFEEMIFTVH